MKTKKTKRKISLSRKIFQYLLGAILFSLILLGFFWINGKLNEYNADVAYLKRTFSETKKAEIKNKILQVKDKIYWIRNNPYSPLTEVLKSQVRKLNHAVLPGQSITEMLSRNFKDSLNQIPISINIIKNYETMVSSYNSIEKTGNLQHSDRTKLLNYIKTKKTADNGIFAQYHKLNKSDSILKTITYFDNKILTGFTVTSTVSSEYFEKVLQKFVLDTLSRLRYAKDDYIFINTFSGKALVSNGKCNNPPVDIVKSDNIAWKKVFAMEQLSATEPDGLFYTYTWQKISSSKTPVKTSYFSYLPEWKWIIGTGFYEDDIDSIIELKRKALFADLRKNIQHVILFLLISIFLSYLIALFFAKRLQKNIGLFKNFFQKAAIDDIPIDKLQVSYKEFDKMAEAANLMIEERKKVKFALYKSEEKFAKAFKNSPDSIIITSLVEGYIMDANDSTERITGYPLHEILGQTTIVLDFWVHLEERNRFVSIINENGRVENFEAELRMKSGEIRIGLFSGEIIELDNEKYILNVIHDITERKKSEKTLQLSEERYRFLFEHNPASMLIYERNTYKMLAVNEAFLKHYGYTSQEILYMSYEDLYPEKEKIPIMEMSKNLKGHAHDGEWHHIKKDGSLITIIITSHDLIYMGRDARIAVVTDISERKQAEEELYKLNTNLLKAQKMAHLGFLDWDLITNEIIPSEEIYKLYGLPLGKKYETPEFVEKVSHPDDVGYIRENLDMALKNMKPYNIDHRIVRPNGETLWVNAQAELIRDNSGLPVRLLGTVMDITERKKSANEIRKLNQSLEERVAERTTQLISINKELESFSYSISHDLRAPLRAIYGFSQILASRHRPSLNEEGRQYMDYIVEASVRMEQLINDLLNYSRLGRKSLNFRPVSLAAVVGSIRTDFKQKLEEIRANFNVNTNLPEILGDESLLLQIFTNLIENAITYRRTEIPLEINISCSLEENGHIIKISDNGIGISKEYWEKIFNIFQRLHTEDKYPGTGIGLATVRKAANMLGGNVWVESVLGSGSTFFINLPINKTEILNE